ncbi:hypothetical protein PVAG01_11130 [Phlyctema vagabunda]|uniref:Major facilitator superfamily (MFS) profile domain-containing protein n=1 Tax=Phlyctema vagabunda TaxID=108571 RepID=A0ABR4P1G0_9HELO
MDGIPAAVASASTRRPSSSSSATVRTALEASRSLSQQLVVFLPAIAIHNHVENESAGYGTSRSNRFVGPISSLYQTISALPTALSTVRSVCEHGADDDDDDDGDGRDVETTARTLCQVTAETLQRAEEMVLWLAKTSEPVSRVHGYLADPAGARNREQTPPRRGSWETDTDAEARLQRDIEIYGTSLRLLLLCMNMVVNRKTWPASAAAPEVSVLEIQSILAELKQVILTPIPFSAPREIKRLDLNIPLHEFDNLASEMAQKCLTVATALCGKVPQSDTYHTPNGQKILGSDSVLWDGDAPQPATPGGGLTRPDTGEYESLEIMNTHIANDYEMAIIAVKNDDFHQARTHILEAITTAQEREAIYSFPFEDEDNFRETLAYILRKSGHGTDAKSTYIKLLRKAEASNSVEVEGRICFGLANIYQDQFLAGDLDKGYGRFFEDWRNYALRAYESALRDPGRPYADAAWTSHPSLRQSAEMVSDMYNSWGKPAKAMTYKQRHPVPPETTTPDATPWSSPSMDIGPPSPPVSDEQKHIAASEGTSEDNIFFDHLSSLVHKNFKASGLLILHKIEMNDYEGTKFFLDLAQGSVDMEQTNERGLTPLLLAVHKRHTEIVRLLLEHEGSPNVKAKDKNGWTVLHHALSGWDEREMVDLLVKHGADVNAPSTDGTTPLHCAVNNNKLHGAQLLLQQKAATEVRDTAGRSPMYMAVTKNRHDMVGLLLRHGAVCDRQAFLRENPDLEAFFDECEDSGILPPEVGKLQPPKQKPQHAPAEQARRPSVLSTLSPKKMFRRTWNGDDLELITRWNPAQLNLNKRDARTAATLRHKVLFKDLLEKNELGIIDSPLQWTDPEAQDENVRKTHAAHHLGDTLSEELFIRGGRLARDEELFLSLEENHVTDLEREALSREKTSTLWQQSKELKVILLACCFAAIAQGWDQASLSGANLRWPAEFGLSEKTRTRDAWIFGGVNSITYFAASSVGAWITDPLNEHFYGRRGALFVAGLFSFVGVVASAFCQEWGTLFFCRLLVGVGMGAKASVVPIFESEIAPARIRGRLLVSWQTFTALGIFLGNAANLIVHRDWRWQTASGFIPALILLTLVFLCSESPRWLIKQGRYKKAYGVLLRLREHHLLAARDLYYIHAQIQVETTLFSAREDVELQLNNWSANVGGTMYQEEFKRTSYARRVVQLFTISRNQRAATASLVVMAAQQMSGINIFAFLAASFLTGARGFTALDSLWLSFGFGAGNFVFSPLAYWYIDTKGRRWLLLISLAACFPMLLATGFSFTIDDLDVRIAVLATFLILFTLAYSPGAGVVPFLYSSEIWPLITREVGMSWACFWNFLLAGVLALTVPQLSTAMGETGLLSLFAGLDALAFVLVWLLVPGTAKVTTLEDMNYVFGVPTRRHCQYQVREVLPWLLRRAVSLFGWRGSGSGKRPPPLYRWERRRRRLERQAGVAGDAGGVADPATDRGFGVVTFDGDAGVDGSGLVDHGGVIGNELALADHDGRVNGNGVKVEQDDEPIGRSSHFE